MNNNSLLNFTLENLPIRGSIVFLESTWNDIRLDRDYPEIIEKLLGELLICSTLLSSMIKLNGSLSIQIQGKGGVEVLVAETNSPDYELSPEDIKEDEDINDYNFISLRGTAKFSEKVKELKEGNHLPALLENALLSITIDPRRGGKRYQSIIPVSENTIEKIFEEYLDKSEQIEGKIAIFNSNEGIGGVILQKLPEQEIQDGVSFEYDYNSIMEKIKKNIKDLSKEEITNLNFEQLLTKVTDKFDVRIFDYQTTRFVCGCSREKIERVLLTIGRKESEEILKEHGNITVNCEFCKKEEKFDSIDVASIFSSTTKSSKSLN